MLQLIILFFLNFVNAFNYDLDDIYGPIPIDKFIIIFATITFIMFLTQFFYT